MRSPETTPPFPFRGVLYALVLEATIAVIVFAAVHVHYLFAAAIAAAAGLELFTQSSAPDRTSRQMRAAEGADKKGV